MKITLLEGGSLRIEGPIKEGFRLKWYAQDSNDPQIYHPKFDGPCCFREDKTRITTCQRVIIGWKCHLFQRQVGIPECRGCDVPESEKLGPRRTDGRRIPLPTSSDRQLPAEQDPDILGAEPDEQ